MSVEKFIPFIENESIPYAQINQYVIDNIEDPLAGFIWIYLISKPKTWIVVREHLMKKYGIGDNKMKRIFAYLKKCNLIEYIQEKGEKGVFGKSNIRVLNGSKFKSYPQKTTAGMETAPADIRTSGFEGLVINNKQKEIKNRERAKKRAPLSQDFIPDKETRALFKETAKRCGIDPNELAEKFIDVCKTTNKMSADWNAELRNFLRREKPSSKKQSKPRHDESRSSVPEWGPNHPSWKSVHGDASH